LIIFVIVIVKVTRTVNLLCNVLYTQAVYNRKFTKKSQKPTTNAPSTPLYLRTRWRYCI